MVQSMYFIPIIPLYYYDNRGMTYVRLIYYIRFYFQTGIAELLLLLNYYFHQSFSLYSQYSVTTGKCIEDGILCNNIPDFFDRGIDVFSS
jgi:hypothetical protein